MPQTTLTVDIDYNDDLTDPEGLAAAMDHLLETALSTPGILDEYGNPRVGEFFVASTEGRPTSLDMEDSSLSVLRRLVEWAEHTGGWDAPVWDEARQLLRHARSSRPGPMVVVEISGGVLQEAYASDPATRLVLVDWDADAGDVGKDRRVVEILGDYGRSQCAYVTEFSTVPIASLPGTDAAAAMEKARIACRQGPDDGAVLRRWVVYSLDMDELITTRAYASYDEAAEDASAADELIVLPLVCRGVRA